MSYYFAPGDPHAQAAELYAKTIGDCYDTAAAFVGAAPEEKLPEIIYGWMSEARWFHQASRMTVFGWVWHAMTKMGAKKLYVRDLRVTSRYEDYGLESYAFKDGGAWWKKAEVTVQ